MKGPYIRLGRVYFDLDTLQTLIHDDHQTLLGVLTETRIKGIFVLRVAIGSLALGTQLD